MKDEIKEILEFKQEADYKRISIDEMIILKDCITNLEQELAKEKATKKKAIEYIKQNATYDKETRKCYDDLRYDECDSLLNILGGDE